MTKKISIIAAVTIIAILFWLSLVPWLREGAKFQHVSVWLPPLLALCVLAGSMAIGILLLDQKRWWALMAFLAGAPILVLFGIQYIYLVFLGFLALFVLVAGHNMKRELLERYKLDVGVMARAGMRSIVMPFLIGISFVYYFSPQLQTRAKDGLFPQSFQQTIAVGVQKFVEGSGEAPPGYNTKTAANQAVDNTFGRINTYLRPYQAYLPPLLAFGLFIILLGLGFLFNWLGTLVARLWFVILRKSGFVIIEEKDVKAETIKL